ncbi:hypothetical protein [Pajaroellobacter abortibovis]|uniref:Uncharacterized protein n=1 Tax=Pajaroellobacter abortibovis TaxID=1882918 RepID=A0A1L6MZ39_9BACT|nr:hypothetical protein [Pajaroellobacter abortibovis]APS00792.1 hypothetical protein BCY86_08950 [Pajaroellobacter abortibovis]
MGLYVAADVSQQAHTLSCFVSAKTIVGHNCCFCFVVIGWPSSKKWIAAFGGGFLLMMAIYLDAFAELFLPAGVLTLIMVALDGEPLPFRIKSLLSGSSGLVLGLLTVKWIYRSAMGQTQPK